MTRLSFCSDTHNRHGQLTTQVIQAKPDVLVHCGDWSGTGSAKEVNAFAEWCDMLLHKEYVKHIVAIAGNHELGLDASIPHGFNAEHLKEVLKHAGVVYLENEMDVVCGLSFWGSPYTPAFYDWGFQSRTLEQEESIYSCIPDKVDVLITHGPPYGIRDKNMSDGRCGSHVLTKHVCRVIPRIHAFGHIHRGYGMTLDKDTLFINAATCNEDYKPVNPLITIDHL
jgi:Icc-related predicted phosphoesterase